MSKSTVTGSDESRSPQIINLPSKLPPPTGNLLHDSCQSALNIFELPCARNSLIAGIGSGAGIGVIRGITAAPIIASHWAIATFAIVSSGTWHICHSRLANQRRQVTQLIESMPKRKLKEVPPNL